MMTAAAGMMVRDTLVRARRHLVFVAIEMLNRLGCYRDAVEPLRRMRRSTRPQHEDKHHRANERSPTVHHRRP